MKEKLYKKLAGLVLARENCCDSGNEEWFKRHTKRIHDLVKKHLPHGSGFDDGVKIDLAASESNRLVFDTGYHHMNEQGCYDGWTDHKVIVKPSLAFGFVVVVKGNNRNDIKDYIAEIFEQDLSKEVDDDIDDRDSQRA